MRASLGSFTRHAFLTLALGACGPDEGPAMPEHELPEEDLAGGAELASGVAPRLPSLEVEGSPGALSLEKLDVKVTIAGRLARTEVTQVFRSALPRQSEGTYEMVLPDSAVISRLAMDVEGKMTEGELAEKQRAREIYDSIVRSQKDPALLEWQGGNRFKMQVFPIPAHGTKTVILEYEELLSVRARATRYSYGLPALEESDAKAARIGTFSFSLLSSATGAPVVEAGADGYAALARVEGPSVSLTAREFVPRGPVRVSFAAPRTGTATALAGEQGDERFFVLDVAPSLPASKPTEPRDLVIAIDTSRGIGDRELTRAIDVARAVVKRSPSAQVVIVTGDLDARTCKEALDACVAGLHAGGATNLEELFDHAAAAARALVRPGIVVFTDGVASVGELDGDVLLGRFVRALEDTDHSITTVAIGHEPDTDFLAKLASRGRGHSLRMSPLASVEHTAAAVAHALKVPLVLDVTARVAGFDVEMVKRPAVHLRPGEPLAVLGRMKTAPFEVTFEGTFQGRKLSQTVRVDPSTLPTDKLVTHFWARGHIDALERAATPRQEVVAASLKYGVMSKATSFLVLENDEAYRRFGVDRLRQAARDEEASKNLTKSTATLQSLLGPGSGGKLDRVGDGSIAAASPADAPQPAAPPPPPVVREARSDVAKAEQDEPAAAEAFKVSALQGVPEGGLATAGVDKGFDADAPRAVPNSAPAAKIGTRGRGSGEAGYGFGGGALGNKTDRDVSMTQGTPVILGSIDKEVVRRVVQEHKGQIRYCYEKELSRTPGIFGKIVMKWVINGEGKVTQAQTAETQMRNANVESCLAAKIKTWTFPKPKGGGIVIVNYPFVFKANGYAYDPRAEYVPSAEDEIVALRRELRAARPGTDEELDARRRLFGVLFDRGEYASADSEWAQVAKRFHSGPAADEAILSELHSPQRCARYASDCGGAVRALVLANPLDARVTHGYLASIAPDVLADALLEHAKRGRIDALHVRAMYIAGASLRGGDEGAYRRVRQLCAFVGAPVRKCLAELMADTSAEGGALKAQLQARAFEATIAERRDDLLNLDLLLEEVRLREGAGDSAGARRTLSEIVEFAPHDLDRRQRYAIELESRAMFAEACEAHGHMAALDPSRRDEFRTMMALRRRAEKIDAGMLRECIVDAVSRLPVQRDLSLVLTWEDRDADIDLHVITPSGEEVFFQHRESKDGGLLYYDVTDGFGPEVYTLGSAEKGTYKIELVYYRGHAKDVRGTVTILEHAGTAGEERRDVEFELDEEDYDDSDTIARVRF